MSDGKPMGHEEQKRYRAAQKLTRFTRIRRREAWNALEAARAKGAGKSQIEAARRRFLRLSEAQELALRAERRASGTYFKAGK